MSKINTPVIEENTANTDILDGLKYYIVAGPNEIVRDLLHYHRSSLDMDQVIKITIECGNVKILKHLARLGENVTSHKHLLFAMEFDCPEMIKFMVDNGADIRADYDICMTLACRYGHIHVIAYLESQGMDIHMRNNELLAIACGYNKLSVVKYLVSRGLCIKPSDYYLIEIAAVHKRFSIVRYLLQYVDIQTDHGKDVYDNLIERLMKMARY